MKTTKELDYTQLKNACSKDFFSFQTTAELESIDDIIGQERAVKAFDFGLAVKMKGYNIYMAGPTGTGKTTYACKRTEEIAAKEPVPLDWCYVYNFQNPKRPLALSFEAGTGKRFKEDMSKLVATFQKELQKVFHSDDYEKQKLSITHTFDKKQDALLDDMDAIAAEYDFYVKRSDTSLYFLPLVNGEPLEDDALRSLSEEENEKIAVNSRILQEKTGPILREIQNVEKECEQELEQLDRNVALTTIDPSIKELADRYHSYERAVSYLLEVQEDILKHLDQFMEEEEPQTDVLSSLIPSLVKKTEEDDITLKYGVNLIVDHSESKGAPVVVTFNPIYTNLMGDTEYDSEFGNLTTDFMKIKGGLFHQANGGYLIIQAQDILTIPHAWDALRRVFKTK
ncbi:MAG: AAA family ATPase, partial [Lachnospiraceae bacterium]|nr:AAA family ATPase [Lachnospiraceae bacterium]